MAVPLMYLDLVRTLFECWRDKIWIYFFYTPTGLFFSGRLWDGPLTKTVQLLNTVGIPMRLL